MINNGGCDPSATCSHDPKTNACQCTCKNGYVNTGSASNVVCTGRFIPSTYHLTDGETILLLLRLKIHVSSIMAVAVSIRSVHAMKQLMQSDVFVKLVIQIREQRQV